MNILLVKPRPHKDTINLQSFMLCEPLELEYAAALLERLGHRADIVDLVLDRDFSAALRAGDYQVVAFTAYQIHVGVVKEYARRVKDHDPSIITLVGGVHAEVVPEDFESPFLDVVLTVGLYALAGVMAGVERGASREELSALGRVPKEPCFPFPHPDRSKTARYRPHYNYIYHDRCATIKTSFSCPYDCAFCLCARLGPYFQRELEDVLDELEEIREENVFIVDDDFLFEPQRLRDFCRGLESFKAGELEEYRKRTTVEVNNRAVRILEKYGVQCYSGLIVGFDWEKRDFDALIAYLNSFEHPMVNIQPVTPIKGTPLYEAWKGRITEKEGNYHLFDMAHAVLEPERMSKRAFYYHILRAYWKTSAAGAKKLEKLDSLKTEAAFDIHIYRKK